jgi:hypothetical protein
MGGDCIGDKGMVTARAAGAAEVACLADRVALLVRRVEAASWGLGLRDGSSALA